MCRKPRAKKVPVDYTTKIGSFDWDRLSVLWKEISATPKKAVPGWAEGKAFEHLVLRAFQLSGAEVIWPYSVKINGVEVEQIDGMIICDGITSMVEAKDYDTNLNIAPIAKLRNQLLRRPSGVVGSVFSSKGFTEPAITLANYIAPQAILLWQGPEISYLLSKKDFSGGLRVKYRALIQHGKPDYDPRAGGY